MSKKPDKPIGRALIDESEIDEGELDRIVGGAGPGAERQDKDDGWSRIIDDHSKEIPAHPPGPPGPAQPPKPAKPGTP